MEPTMTFTNTESVYIFIGCAVIMLLFHILASVVLRLFDNEEWLEDNMSFYTIVGIISLMTSFFIAYNMKLTDEMRIAMAEQSLQQEKERLKENRKEAQLQARLSAIEAERLALRNNSSGITRSVQDLDKAKPRGKDTPSMPIDKQTELILSGLWLGASFFLQRLFSKVFKDKGYALLTVCAAGFLLAFFTANYFLLGGSVTGGIMGSVGDRG